MDNSEDAVYKQYQKDHSDIGTDKTKSDILFARSEKVSELREEHYDNIFSSDALKTYLKHIGYCKGRKRKRCLSMELAQLLTPKS